MSDVIGEALIEVMPDLGSFSAQLNGPVDQAADQAAQTLRSAFTDAETAITTDLRNAGQEGGDALVQTIGQAGDQASQSLDGAFDGVRGQVENDLRTAGQAGGDALEQGVRSGVSGADAAVSNALSGARSSVTSELRTAGQAGGDALEREVRDGARQAADQVESAFRGVDISGALGAAGAGLGTGALIAGIEGTRVTAGRLEAQLGELVVESREVGEAATQAFRNNYGESMGEAFDITGRVTQALGLAGPELQAVTEGVFGVSDAFGELGAEPQILIENLRTMRAAFPGTPQIDLLGQIAAAFQEGTGSSGDLQDTLQEYPQLFADLGFSSEGMLAVLNAGLDAGARNTDVVADAFKEFGIRVNTVGDTGQEAIKGIFPDAEANRIITAFGEGGDAANDAFFQVLEGLNAIKDPQDQYTAAVELFGTKAEDIGKAKIPEFISGLLDTRDAQYDAAGSLEQLDSQYTGTQNTLQTWGRVLQTSVLGNLTEFAPQAATALEVTGSIGTTFLGAQAAGINLGGAVSKLGSLFGGLFKVLLTNPFVLIIAAVAALAYVIYRNWDTIVAFLTNAWETIRTTASNVWNSIRTTVSNAVTGVVVAVTTRFQEIKARIQLALFAARVVVRTVWANIRTFIANTVNSIRTAIVNRFNAIRSAITNIINAVRNFLRNAWNTIRSTISNAVTAIRQRLTDGFQQAVSAVRTRVQNLIAFVRGIPGRIRSALGNVGSMLYNAGRSIINGLANGIRAAVGNAVSAASGVVSRIRNLLPFSPAKEGPLSGRGSPDIAGRILGEMIGQGLASVDIASYLRPALAQVNAAVAQPAKPNSGLLKAIDAIQGRLASGKGIFEDLSFKGAPAVVGRFNDQIADMLEAQGLRGQAWNDPRAIARALQQLESGLRPAAHTQPQQLVIRGDGSKRADYILDELRAAIRNRGGNVQVVLGSR